VDTVVPDSDSLDWERVRAHLAAHGIALDRDPPPERFSGGLANRNFHVHLAGQAAVFRCPPPGPLPPGAYDMAREQRLLVALPDALPFVPRGLHLCTDPAVIGVPFQLIEYRAGRVVRGDWPADLAARPGAAASLAETLIGTLAAIHAVDPDSVGLGDLGRPQGFLGRAVAGWRKRGAAAATPGAAPLIAELGEWLERRAVADGPPALLHNDFKLDNLVLDEALQPVAVLDWDQGTRGDPLFDLATLLSYWAEPGDPPAMLELHQMPTAEGGFPGREWAAQRYASLTGRSLDGFRFHRVLGLVKLGVIFLQLHGLHRRGATSDPRYAGFGPLAEGLLLFARDAAEGRVF
jgi:aminoglycoside phosphotransferase (APT) family kinase protein